MLKVASSLFLISALVFTVHADDDEDPGSVIVLSEDDFADDGKINSGEPYLVKFYAPSCGFCKMLAPAWKSLAKEVVEDELPMNVAKFNVRESRDISQKYNIGKLPGIKLFRDGQIYTFPDARSGKSSDEYIEYSLETFAEVEAEEQARVAKEKAEFEAMEARSKVVKLTVDNFEETTAEGTWLVEFYGPKCGYCKKLQPTWEDLAFKVDADESSGFKVAKFDAAAGFKYTSMLKANPWPAIKLIKDGKFYTFPEPRNFDMSLDDYIGYAQSGYDSEEGSELEYVEAQRKRILRKQKYAAKKAAKEAKKHDEL